MTTRGILFRPDMLAAILAGRKTETRRLDLSWAKLKRGDTLWVKEKLVADSPGPEAGPRSALPETREVPRPPVDPGPMPPRWRRSAGWYLHDTFAAAVGLEPDMAICIAVSAAGADMDRVESDLRDAADLVAWLRRGGR